VADSVFETSPLILQVWEKSPDGLLIADSNGVIVEANRLIHQMFDYPHGQLIGQSIEVLVPESLRGVHRGLRHGYHQKPVTRQLGSGMHLLACKYDGTVVPVEISLAPFDGGDYVLSAVRDVSDRMAVEAHLAELNLKRLIAEDRERIARELHDTVIQELFVLGMQLQTAIGIEDGDIDDRLSNAVDSLDNTVNEIRRVIFEVQALGHERGMRAELMRIIAERTAVFPADPRVRFVGDLDELTEDVAGHVCAVLSEALANVVRHSEADEISVEVEYTADRLLQVMVSDNGIGITSPRRSGLQNLARRAAELDGNIEIESAPGEGTTIRWVVTVPEEKDAS